LTAGSTGDESTTVSANLNGEMPKSLAKQQTLYFKNHALMFENSLISSQHAS